VRLQSLGYFEGVPSRTPTLAEVIRTALDARLAEVHVSLPARVERYDEVKQLVDVKPLLREAVFDADGVESHVSLPVITNVPVVFPGAGGFRLTFPVAAGDTVLLVFAERSLDQWLSSGGGEADPVDLRQHALSDAVAMPGLHTFTKPWTGASTSALTLGKDGGPQVEIDDIDIKLHGGILEVARRTDPVSVDLSGLTLTGTIAGSPATFTVGLGVSATGTITDGAPHVKA
jgi:hypothetical protein